MQESYFEKRAKERGFQAVAGIDEAGRGPLAGPVVASACIFEEGVVVEGVDDSKKLTPFQRYRLYEQMIQHSGIAFGLGIVEAIRIDQINILQATFEAMLIAIAALSKKPDYLLVDGSQLPPTHIPAEAVVKGDGLCPIIAAASILAKETRDRIMVDLHKKWPQYGFNQHKGYATKEHLTAISLHGPCPVHRMSFEMKQDVGPRFH
jgi:ribonuclease HII